MASSKPLASSSLLVILSFILSSATPSTVAGDAPTDFIRKRCIIAGCSGLCFDSLAPFASTVNQNPLVLARVALNLALGRLRYLPGHVSKLSGAWAGGEAERLNFCCRNLDDAVGFVKRAVDEISGPEQRVSPVSVRQARTLLGAALSSESLCVDAMKKPGVGGGFQQVGDDVSKRVHLANYYTWNAQALVTSLDPTPSP